MKDDKVRKWFTEYVISVIQEKCKEYIDEKISKEMAENTLLDCAMCILEEKISKNEFERGKITKNFSIYNQN